MESGGREAEMRRRREEQRRLAQRRHQRKKKRKKNTGGVLLTMLCLLLVGGLTLAAFTVLFPVKKIEVVGNIRYSPGEIIKAADIKEGQNLLRLNPQDTEDQIRVICPYVSNLVMKRKLPNKVVLQITESDGDLAFPVEGGYLLTTNAYETIAVREDAGTALVVYGVGVAPTKGGQRINFENKTQFDQLKSIMEELNKQNITQITKMDFSDPLAVRLQYGQQHIWKLGDLSNLAYKLQFGSEVSKGEKGTGTIDLSGLTSGKNAYFKSEVLGEFVPTATVPPQGDETPTDVAAE